MPTPRKTKRPRRLGVALAALLAALTFGAVAAQGDVVNNDIAAHPGSDTINAGGSTIVGYRIVGTGGDGQPGCNASDLTPPTVTIHAPAAVSVSPGSLTFTSCGTFKNATFSSSAVGNYLITVTVSDAGPGTYNTTPATWTLHVVNTPPTVTISGVADGGSYTTGSVPAAICHVTDAEDGLSDSTSAASPTLSAISGPYAADGIGQQSAECSYTDAGGLSANASATYSIVDSSAPDIAYAVDGTLGNNNWYTSDVSLIWGVSELESPSSLVTTGCADQSITADQPDTSYDCSATSAGGSSGLSVSIKRDAHAPAFDCGTVPTGWQAGNVTLDCTATDIGPAGLVAPATFALFTSVVDGDETNAASTNAEAITDDAGNFTVAQYTFMIDRKAPGVSCGSADGLWHATNVDIACTGSDGGSGLADAADASFLLSTNVPAGAEDANASTGTHDVLDAVGNTVVAGPVAGNMVDRKGPTVTCGATPTFTLNEGSATVSASVTDGGSGAATPSLTTAVSTATPGTHSASLTGFDNVGNSTSVGCPYHVVYVFAGFFAPVNNPDTVNTGKAGRTYPVKWRLSDAGGNLISALSAVASITSKATSCASFDMNPESALEAAATGGTVLRYDSTADQYVYNWATAARGCYTLFLTLDDGTVHRAFFNLS